MQIYEITIKVMCPTCGALDEIESESFHDNRILRHEALDIAVERGWCQDREICPDCKNKADAEELEIRKYDYQNR
jgi:hypothetical protein